MIVEGDFLVAETHDASVDVLYALGEGCSTKYITNDEAAGCHKSRCQMVVNGVTIKPAGILGFNFLVLDPTTLEIKESRNFDTHNSATAATSMTAWANNLPTGVLLMMCSMDEATILMDIPAWALLVFIFAICQTSFRNVVFLNTTQR